MDDLGSCVEEPKKISRREAPSLLFSPDEMSAWFFGLSLTQKLHQNHKLVTLIKFFHCSTVLPVSNVEAGHTCLLFKYIYLISKLLFIEQNQQFS